MPPRTKDRNIIKQSFDKENYSQDSNNKIENVINVIKLVIYNNKDLN